MEHPEWIQPYRPLAPMERLVVEVNRIFHALDAEAYDATHVEMREIWPGLWAEMMVELPGRGKWRVLDFGSGTGFAAGQVLRRLADRVESVAAYDPSPEMLARAQARLGADSGSNNKVMLLSDPAEVAEAGPYNLLLTNSVLHHLPDVKATMAWLLAHLSAGAYWLMGNEPSARFYRNAECRALAEEYANQAERNKWFSVPRYRRRLKRLAGVDTLSRTARASVEAGLFARKPSHQALDRLIDFHVAHSDAEARAGRGFDLERMQTEFGESWTLRWSKSYSYLGSVSEAQAPRQWRERAEELGRRHPRDGANFCAVWQRT